MSIVNLDDECIICYEELHDEYITPCKHPVHHYCFLKTNKNTCPMCRQTITYPLQPVNCDYVGDLYTISMLLIIVIFMTLFFLLWR